MYNRNTGICAYNAKKRLDLRINTTTLHNIRESGFKIGADTAATEALDVAGNILASGSITSSSAIINGVNIGSGLTSLETQVGGKQNTLTSSNNITTGSISSGSITGRTSTTITAPTITATSNLFYGTTNVATKISTIETSLNAKQDLITSSTNLTCNKN